MTDLDVIERILTTPDRPARVTDFLDPDDWRGYVSSSRVYTPLEVLRTRGYDPGPFVPVPAPEIFPSVVVGSIAPPARIPKPADIGPTTVAVAEDMGEVPVIDPETAPTATVFEDAPGGIYERANPVPTDWDRVYEEYVELNAPATGLEDVMAVDWGDVLGNVLGGIAGGLLDPVGLGSGVRGLVAGPPSAMASPGLNQIPATGITGVTGMQQGVSCPPVGPRYAKICLATGQVMPLKRRRRRRLLTASDLADISSLVAIVGKGAATNAVVTRAVSRS